MLATMGFSSPLYDKFPYYKKVPTTKGWRVIIVWYHINDWAMDFNFVSKDGLTEKEADTLINKLKKEEK